MGNSLPVPVCYALNRIFANENGFSSGVKEILAYSYLERTYKQNRRLDLYNLEKVEQVDLENINFIIPHQEISLEYPRKISNDEEIDTVFFCGFNESGETLVTKISQDRNGMSSVWVFLRLKNGKNYRLPGEKLYRTPNRTGPESFVAGGLRLRCLQPMRKWRVSFSGLLNLEHSVADDDQLVYVRFSFTWTASSNPYDFNHDVSTKTFARYLAKGKWSTYYPSLSELSGQLDCYVQSGNLVGTYQIDGEDENEIYLWGTRQRRLERISREKPYSESEYFAYLEEGEMLYFGDLGYQTSDNNKFLHGYVVQGNSLSGAVEVCSLEDDTVGQTITFERGEHSLNATFSGVQEWTHSHNIDGSNSTLVLTSTEFNEGKGKGLIITRKCSPGGFPVSRPKYYLPDLDPDTILGSSYVVSLNDQSCRATSLTGGKGSSLADLHKLSLMDGTFSVPKGIVVTTTAYEEFLKGSSLEKHISCLEITAWKNIPVGLKKECERVSEVVGQVALSDSIKREIKTALVNEFGKDYEIIRLAVRSSASGEDSEEMSAAGQMKTFLGIKGLDMVYESVVQCWASQFDFPAIQYKRQNGQPLNSPMAVVIQEMVAAEVAGVMFTCDPVTGNPARITITANYGIGESVVSASAEPDTIIVKRTSKGESEIKSVQLGAKKTRTVLTETGVKEEKLSENISSECSLSLDIGKQLADIGIQIEDSYGCVMDIEWAVNDNRIYLLQARPVTTFDKETDFELIHEADTHLRSESEWLTTANLGEVFPGAMSYLGMTAYNKALEILFANQKFKICNIAIDTFAVRLLLYPLTTFLGSLGHYRRPQNTGVKRANSAFLWSPYFQNGMLFHANHIVLNIMDFVLKFYYGKHTLVTSTLCFAYFGRILDDPEMLRKAVRRNFFNLKVSAPPQIFYLLSDTIFASSRLKKRRISFPVGSRFEMPLSYTSEKLYFEICHQWIRLYEIMTSHFECSIFSSFSSMILISLLTQGTGEMNLDALSDLGYILSHCSDVESVDVPNAIEKVAGEIIMTEEGQSFHKMDPREALMWIERSDSAAGKEFQLLLKKHGHRCIQEMDLYSKPWGSDPIPLIKTIQELVARRNIQERKKTRIPESPADTIKNLKAPLTWKSRFIMKLIIPLCRKAVALREGAKSLLISTVDCMRHSYRRLANQMVIEGRLPESDIIYFLTHYELLQLIRTRSPKLIQKATRRKTLYSSMNEIIYPEMWKGIPKPINFAEKETVKEGSLKMNGIPVSQGSATGLARVATNLQEAQDLKPGEILIAFSTDIAWSPYFPMLGGVATELGGLVSHGAVVAREYGLPCVVGVHGATLKFRTGDKVFIDGTKGILSRLDD